MINLDKYKSNLVLNVRGIEKNIQDWDKIDGVVGLDSNSFSLDYINESKSFNINELFDNMGGFIIDVISNNLYIDVDSIFVNGEGYISITQIEDGDSNPIDNESDSEDMFICDYVFKATLNGVGIDFKDLYKIINKSNLNVEVGC